MEGYVIAVDIGGTNIRVALLNEQLDILKKETAFTMEFHSAEHFFTHMAEMVHNVDPKGNAGHLGMALPAPWASGNKQITDITNIPYLEGMQVEEVYRYLSPYKV